jgi:universal stress protein F
MIIERILVALDGSPRAPSVFAAAAELGIRFGATLHPFRVVSIPPEFPAAAAGTHADPLAAKIISEALDELRTLARPSAGLFIAEPVVHVGQVWRAILEASETLDAHVIVMGSHGYHGLDRVLGTTAAKVVNLAHRHVFVVHCREIADSKLQK